ncbi:ABC transporter permease [Achromobacter aloeverae]|uniref:ABC transporter permease n=2 Tax=Achromobacter aloeverae TaxID=1750518 RepID=A0A4Q1HKF1_9BURK|nr:ABC transporter permease [Achromobacter aloeverae]
MRLRRRIDAGTWRLTFGATVALALLLLLVPTFIALAASFNGGESLRFPPRDLSLRWYQALWNESDDIWTAFGISLRVSSLATLGATLLATPAALYLARQQTARARALETLFQSPMMLPGISLGLAMLVWLQMIGVPLSYWSLVIGHMAIATPYIVRTALIGFGQIDPSLLEASRSLGAGGLRTFVRVTLPLALPAVLAGGFIAFMFSFDNVPISLFLSDARSEVLPIRLWNLIENLLDVRAAAVAGALIVFTIVFALVMERVLGVSRYVR